MQKTNIKSISHRTIFDSRGVETLEVDVRTGDGFARVAAPFGAPGSRGEFEAPAYAPGGLAASRALLDKEIIPSLIGADTAEQEKLDDLLISIDGSANFERIGGNTATILSIAFARAASDALRVPMYKLLKRDAPPSLPYPLGNVVGGGAHSLGPAPDMQEHMVLALGARSVRHAIEINLKVHAEAGKVLEKRDPGFSGGMDDEDAWAANLDDVGALEVLLEAKKRVEDAEGCEIRMGLDLAADRLWNAKRQVYSYTREGVDRTAQQQLDFVGSLIERFDLIYVEDAFHSTDYDSFAKMNAAHGRRCIICADDIYASNTGRTQAGIDRKSARAMIVKPNQVGTLTGARRTAELARANGMKIIISNRSGETADVSIADLSVAWNATMIKAGVRGGGRIIKLNELIRIEQEVPGIKLAEWKEWLAGSDAVNQKTKIEENVR
jgi:enolase